MSVLNVFPQFSKKLLFINGKGGVGKTTFSQALALTLASQKKRTLWICFESPHPDWPLGTLLLHKNHLWILNAHAMSAFEEYTSLLISWKPLRNLFTQNKLIRYFIQATPGLRELLLLGKSWYEQDHFDHIVIDMPSSGYGLAFFQSVQNFSKLFHRGPLFKDLQKIVQTLQDPKQTSLLILTLPEDMPLEEAIEFQQDLRKIIPSQKSTFMVNKVFPTTISQMNRPFFSSQPTVFSSLIPNHFQHYSECRTQLETHNLQAWKKTHQQSFLLFPFLPPPRSPSQDPFEGTPKDLSRYLLEEPAHVS